MKKVRVLNKNTEISSAAFNLWDDLYFYWEPRHDWRNDELFRFISALSKLELV